MHRIPLVALVLLAAVARPAMANDLNLTEVWRRSDVVVLAQVPDPPTVLDAMPVPGARPFQRQLRDFRVLKVLRGRAPSQVRVDEAGWRAEYAALVRCAGQPKCAIPKPDRYRGTLRRDPLPGDQVLVFLRRAHGGLELTAALAIDAASQAAALPKHGGGQ